MLLGIIINISLIFGGMMEFQGHGVTILLHAVLVDTIGNVIGLVEQLVIMRSGVALVLSVKGKLGEVVLRT